MSKSKQTSGKKDREKQRNLHRKEKAARKEERKANSNKGAALEDMFAYVNEFGQLTSTPPDPLRNKPVFNVDSIQISTPKQLPPDPADAFRTGTLTFFNQSKGYGFIKDLASQESIFVHKNGMMDEVSENQKVSFEVEKGEKGPVAVNVKRA